jgi:alkanesulfonate monooxygenase SsuD/methylene tetrahydromethanopterin reductase-like flavin-dependent oxidoreductase (luciferase family)
MRLGLMFSFEAGLAADRVAQLGREAEAAGYDWLAVNEYGNDPFVLAAALGLSTTSATIATGVANIGVRHPVATAGAAAELLALTHGRFVLGLGVGHAEVNGHALGLPTEQPRLRMTEYIEIVRRLLAGGPVSYDGALQRAVDIQLGHPTPAWPLPIHVGLLNPESARRLAPLVDGFLLNFAPVEYAAELVRVAREAAAAAGRDPASLTIAALVHTFVGTDRDTPAALRVASERIARTFARLRFYRTMLRAAGFAAEADAIEALQERGVSERLAEAIFPGSGLPAYLDRLAAAGVDVAVLEPYPAELTWPECLEAAIRVPGELAS